MGQLSPILRNASDGMLLFWCPGCDGAHGIKTGTGEGPRWGYNGNPYAPTFTPSILVRWGDKPGDRCCHSFVTDGKIQFLNDCTHPLAGQTVPLPPWDD